VDHIQFNIVSPQFKADPFPLMAQLRASRPLCRTTLRDKTPVWLLTRYEDVATLLKDERFVKDKRKAMTAEQLRKMPWGSPNVPTTRTEHAGPRSSRSHTFANVGA
jgi:cytochrome P450